MNCIINEPENPIASLILAHGSGAGMDTDFMTTIAEGLYQKNITVIRFEFPYMAKARKTGKRHAPNKTDVLLTSYRSVIANYSSSLPLFIGGKSMEGRIASMLAETENVQGCLCLGYPFHPPGKPNKLRTDHLKNNTTPICIIQGTRDPFGTKAEVDSYDLSPQTSIHFLENGDHSFKTRKKDPQTTEQSLTSAIALATEFMLQNAPP